MTKWIVFGAIQPPFQCKWEKDDNGTTTLILETPQEDEFLDWADRNGLRYQLVGEVKEDTIKITFEYAKDKVIEYKVSGQLSLIKDAVVALCDRLESTMDEIE